MMLARGAYQCSDYDMLASGFKFNFEIQNDAAESSEAKDMQECDHVVSAAPARELFIEPFHHELAGKYKFATSECGNASLHLKHALSEDVRRQINAFKTLETDQHKMTTCSALLEAVTINSDLIPGIYEGGLKIWEGSCDLLDYLCTSKTKLSNARVLELGCGAGLPGIAAVLHGASSVTFQDYNPGVIHLFTIPNLLANVTTRPLPPVKFFAGDWSNLVNLLNPDDNPMLKYDIVLTSETIYSIDSQPKLIELIKKHIKPCTGKVFVAAKSHYFGVGGSMDAFKTLIKNDGFFKCTSCMTVTNCSIPREVILLEQL